MEKKRSALMLVSFLAYYVILFGERLYSLVMSFTDKNIGFKQMFLGATFNKYVYGMTLISLAIFLILFLRILGKLLSVGIVSSSGLLIFDAAVLLVAGMLHTDHTVTIIQFIAYIFLLIGCLSRFLEIMRQKEAYASTIASYVYFVAFSMAIPTVNKTASGNQNIMLYVVTALGSLGLILVFTIMMLFLFSEEKFKHVNNPIFFAAMVGVNAILALLSLKNTADLNWFALAFTGIAVIAYIVTLLLLAKDRRSKIL